MATIPALTLAKIRPKSSVGMDFNKYLTLLEKILNQIQDQVGNTSFEVGTVEQEDIYGVVEKPNFAVVIPIENDHVYLVDQYRYPIGRRSLEFPMGADDNNPEASYEAVARSELREETGMSAGQLTDLGLAYSTCGYATANFRTFVATDLTQGETALEPAEEGLITRRVKLSDFEQMILTGEIIDGQTLAAYLLFKLKWA